MTRLHMPILLMLLSKLLQTQHRMLHVHMLLVLVPVRGRVVLSMAHMVDHAGLQIVQIHDIMLLLHHVLALVMLQLHMVLQHAPVHDLAIIHIAVSRA